MAPRWSPLKKTHKDIFWPIRTRLLSGFWFGSFLRQVKTRTILDQDFILEGKISRYLEQFKINYSNGFIKWGASSRWPLSLLCSRRNSDKMTTGNTHPTLSWSRSFSRQFPSSLIPCKYCYSICSWRHQPDNLTDNLPMGNDSWEFIKKVVY